MEDRRFLMVSESESKTPEFDSALRATGRGEQDPEIESARKENRIPAETKLSNPTTYCAYKIASFFAGDPDVFTSFNYFKNELRILVKGDKKAGAINALIKHEHAIGAMKLLVTVTHVKDGGEWEDLKMVDDTFRPGQVFELVKDIVRGGKAEGRFTELWDSVFQRMYYFVEFAPVACHYKVDNLSNPQGWESALAADVFKYAFDGSDRVFVSTQAGD